MTGATSVRRTMLIPLVYLLIRFILPLAAIWTVLSTAELLGAILLLWVIFSMAKALPDGGHNSRNCFRGRRR